MEILAVDDDPLLLHTISMVLEEPFGEIHTLEHPSLAIDLLDSTDVKVILLDLNFAIGDSDGAEGLAWIKKIKEARPHVSIIVLTAHGFLDIAVQSLKQGATDFLEKPFSNEKLVATVQAGLNLANSQQDLADVTSNRNLLINQANQFNSMVIGTSNSMKQVMHMVNKVANTDASVFITGAHGTGKEVLARLIHQQSARAAQPFINTDLSSISSSLFESTLFGHVKGAFTGATSTRSGYFEVADGGTIFLDEVGELPLTTQVRLLRVLENGEFLKVGSSQVQKTDVRIVAATNIQMFEAIKKEKFREDLYYRLSTVEINIPPLRERKEDIHLLFRKFASDFGRKYKMPTIRLTDDAIQLLLKYRWPGNIRQLRNIAEQVSVLEEGRTISGAILHGYLPNVGSNNLPAVIGGEKKEGDFSTEREILYKVLFDMKGDLNDLKKLTLELLKNNDTEKVQEENENLIRKIYGEDGEEVPSEDRTPLEVLHLPEPQVEQPLQHSFQEDKYHFAEEIEEEETLSLQEKEIELIKKSLERNRGKRKAAASELGISERTLYRKIKQYDL